MNIYMYAVNMETCSWYCPYPTPYIHTLLITASIWGGTVKLPVGLENGQAADYTEDESE